MLGAMPEFGRADSLFGLIRQYMAEDFQRGVRYLEAIVHEADFAFTVDCPTFRACVAALLREVE